LHFFCFAKSNLAIENIFVVCKVKAPHSMVDYKVLASVPRNGNTPLHPRIHNNPSVSSILKPLPTPSKRHRLKC